MGDVLDQLCARAPALHDLLARSRFAVGNPSDPACPALSLEEARPLEVGAATEIAVLPPISGGGGAGEDATSGADPGARSGSQRESALRPSAAAGTADVGDKAETARSAEAECRLVVRPPLRDRLLRGEVPKGDAVGAARIAGILAAKRTPELIPLCHPVRLDHIALSFSSERDDAIVVRALVRGRDRTGFEMEALVAAAMAALTLYDMGKSEDPAMHLEGLRLLAKSGGGSGEWRAP